ncbi:RNA-directed DNA polymerase, eukaryota, reverse transcriptase zinc-binding domain protein [Tanacetum coccineum]
MFYADDAVFVGQWNDKNINTLTHVLECFYLASGLRINMNKSRIMGVHVNRDNVHHAAGKLGCLILNSPFSYLGTKVGGLMSRSKAWNEVIEKVKSWLSKWKMNALSIGGRLTLLKSVLGSIPIFYVYLSGSRFEWASQAGLNKVNFSNGYECRQASKGIMGGKMELYVLAGMKRLIGGLGVSSIFALFGDFIDSKWLWKGSDLDGCLLFKEVKEFARRKEEKGGESTDCLSLKLGNGESTSFWHDNWFGVGVAKDIFPRLFALEDRKEVSVRAKLNDLCLGQDRWAWSLEGSGDFSVASIRKVIDANRLKSDSSKTRWVKFVPIKINVFAWKIKMDALPSRLNITRRGIDIQSITCPICDDGIETTEHLFFRCQMANQIARKIATWWNLDLVAVNTYDE